jgi:hypothetical protein
MYRTLGPFAVLTLLTACGPTSDVGTYPYSTPPASTSRASTAVLTVDSFSIIEFTYPTATNFWYYAPQVRVRVSGDAGEATISRMEFDIPGLGAMPPCNSGFRLNKGEQLDLFTEVYGDYAYILTAFATRSTGSDATLTVTVTDSQGTDRRVVVKGRIVPGKLPETYSGGTPVFQCR